MLSGSRLALAVVIAATITFVLFRLMHLLIAMTEMVLDDDRDRERIEFVRLRQDSQTQTRKRELPQRQQPKQPPKTPEMDRSDDSGSSATAVDVGAPQIEAGLDLTGALKLGAAPSDSEEVPVVRVEPIYPRRAGRTVYRGMGAAQVRCDHDGRDYQRQGDRLQSKTDF